MADTGLDLAKLTQETKLTNTTFGGLKVESVNQKAAFINFLVYGDPGVGKTILSGSASIVEEMSPVLLIDVEGGTLSLRTTFPKVETVRVQNFKELDAVYGELHRGNHPYKTVVLDSLTELQKLSMLVIMRDLMNKEPDRDPEIPSVREWGKNIEQTRRVVRAFRDLRMHTIFTALAQTDKDVRTGVLLTKPSLSGKVANEVGGFIDILAYLYVKKDKDSDELVRMLLTTRTDKEAAKDRSGKLPQVIKNPSMQLILNYINGQIEKDETK